MNHLMCRKENQKFMLPYPLHSVKLAGVKLTPILRRAWKKKLWLPGVRKAGITTSYESH